MAAGRKPRVAPEPPDVVRKIARAKAAAACRRLIARHRITEGELWPATPSAPAAQTLAPAERSAPPSRPGRDPERRAQLERLMRERPWERPGHRFTIDWPPGYEPVLAAEACATPDAAQARATSTATLERLRQEGCGWGTPIAGLSQRADQRIAETAPTTTRRLHAAVMPPKRPGT